MRLAEQGLAFSWMRGDVCGVRSGGHGTRVHLLPGHTPLPDSLAIYGLGLTKGGLVLNRLPLVWWQN